GSEIAFRHVERQDEDFVRWILSEVVENFRKERRTKFANHLQFKIDFGAHLGEEFAKNAHLVFADFFQRGIPSDCVESLAAGASASRREERRDEFGNRRDAARESIENQ